MQKPSNWGEVRWQQIFYAEFDGQRRKKLIIKAIGE